LLLMSSPACRARDSSSAAVHAAAAAVAGAAAAARTAAAGPTAPACHDSAVHVAVPPRLPQQQAARRGDLKDGTHEAVRAACGSEDDV
jgi:hypothetical protein